MIKSQPNSNFYLSIWTPLFSCKYSVPLTLTSPLKEKSGTLITVDFALEQGKDIYVVPGNINSINSVGTNELIKQGATLVTNYKEVII